MAEDIQEAIKYLQRAREKVDPQIWGTLDKAEVALYRAKHRIEASSKVWESEPLRERLRNKKTIYQIGSEMFQQFNYRSFDAATVEAVIDKFQEKQAEKLPWYLRFNLHTMLFQDGILERKPKPSGRPNDYNYRFRNEGVKIIKKALSP